MRSQQESSFSVSTYSYRKKDAFFIRVIFRHGNCTNKYDESFSVSSTLQTKNNPKLLGINQSILFYVRFNHF